MKVFLSAPFTDRLDPSTQLIETSYKLWLERVMRSLEVQGCNVINSHVREEWGANLYSPGLALQEDLESIEASDLLVAYIATPPSPGVQMELGFAIAHSKPIVLFYSSDTELPYLVKGISQLVPTFYISFASEQELIDKLNSLHIWIKGNEIGGVKTCMKKAT